MSDEAPMKRNVDVTAVRDWMVAYISSVIDMPQDPFPDGDRFDQYGFDSVEITIMCGMMEEEFGIEVNPNEVFDHPNVLALSAHIANRVTETAAVG